jgi:hypothetical protein
MINALKACLVPFLLLLAALALAVNLEATTSGPGLNRPNNLGVEQFYTNPNVYLFGVISCHGDGDCSILKDAHERLYTNLKFQPYNTMELYEEPVLFCGNVASYFNGKQGALVITYRRQATLNYKGIGCHELYSVFEVSVPQGGW